MAPTHRTAKQASLPTIPPLVALGLLCMGCGGPADAERLVVTTRALPVAAAGQEYEAALAASGSVEPYIWSLTTGSLPSGLALEPDGRLHGKPDREETKDFTVQVEDGRGSRAARRLRVDVQEAGTHLGRHVSPAGDDDADGTEASPWRTVQHAAETAGPGDTVYLHEGRYDGDVVFAGSGTADAPITFTVYSGPSPAGEQGADDVVLAGHIIIAGGVTWVRLDGFTIEGYTDWGIELSGNNHHIELTNLVVTGGEACIHLTYGDSGSPPEEGPVSDILISDCVASDCEYTAIDGTPGPCDRITVRRVEVYGAGLVGEDSFGADGIAFERGRDILVEDCFVHDNGGDGIDLNSRDFGGNVSGIVVRGNTVARNHLNGIKMWSGGRMERNVVWGQGVTPVVIGIYDCAAEVVRNTVAYNMWDASFSGRDYAATFGWPEAGTPRVRLTFTGNIWAFNTGPDVGTPTGIYLGEGVELVDEQGNLFHSREDEELTGEGVDQEFSRADIRDGRWAAASGHGQGDLTEDPLFVSGWPDVDLHLRPDSPAQGTGAH